LRWIARRTPTPSPPHRGRRRGKRSEGQGGTGTGQAIHRRTRRAAHDDCLIELTAAGSAGPVGSLTGPRPALPSRCITRPGGGELRGVVLEDEAGDGVAGRAHGELALGEPARVLELLTIDRDVAADVARDEADHELAGERPVLAADVLDVVDVDADLFLDLAPHRALQRLA